MVAAREADEIVKVMLDDRFQIAIDEVAMRLGSIDSDSYLAGWHTSQWADIEGKPVEVAAQIAESLETQFDQETLDTLLESIGNAD